MQVAKRREPGDGSIYQRSSDNMWIASIEAGSTLDGTRRRITVSAKTRPAVVRKLRDKKLAIEAGGIPTVRAGVTVKQWVDTYLELRMRPPKPLSPNGWNAAASPLRKWVVPKIGHIRLDALAPAHLRQVEDAQYAAGRKTSTADATQRAFMTCLNWAVREGHMVPMRVLKAPRPGMGRSDRRDLNLDETIACLEVASQLPHGLRWLLALLYGARLGEVLGMTEDEIRWDTHEIHLEWQLQDLQRVDPKNARAGYRMPRDYEAIHLRGAYHLVRPKSRSGYRVLPMTEAIEEALRDWLAIRPANPWGLVFPNAAGRPQSDKSDREEWQAIQCTAGVGHPGGRWYHIHECRNFAATQLDEVKASDNVITSLLGHASIVTSRRYQTAHSEPKRAAIAAVEKRLQPPTV